jgi:hypothetical protein
VLSSGRSVTTFIAHVVDNESLARDNRLVSIRIDEKRLEKILVEKSFEVHGAGHCVPLQEVLRVIKSLTCKTDGCTNEARYSSGMCSICDMVHNDGQGKRITNPE